MSSQIVFSDDEFIETSDLHEFQCSPGSDVSTQTPSPTPSVSEGSETQNPLSQDLFLASTLPSSSSPETSSPASSSPVAKTTFAQALSSIIVLYNDLDEERKNRLTFALKQLPGILKTNTPACSVLLSDYWLSQAGFSAFPRVPIDCPSSSKKPLLEVSCVNGVGTQTQITGEIIATNICESSQDQSSGC